MYTGINPQESKSGKIKMFPLQRDYYESKKTSHKQGENVYKLYLSKNLY